MIPSDTFRQGTGTSHRSLCVLGSTGSIGVSTLDIVRHHRDRFTVDALIGGKNIDLLAEQAREFGPRIVACSDPADEARLRAAIGGGNVEVTSGAHAIAEIAAARSSEIVVAAIVGVAGLAPVFSALKVGKRVALANKESLVAAGGLIKSLLQESGGVIVPVDSEHSAIFQCLLGRRPDELSTVILTASGGPFLRTPAEKFPSITPQDAIRHPRWSMGAKISVDSATLMNKALEVIEAHWLFDLPEERIEVVVHPESIIHSFVRLNDGSLIAQLSVPDMRGAIAFSLMYPHGRLSAVMEPLDLLKVGALNFVPLDQEKFGAIALARSAIRSGGGAAAVLNVANEIAVNRFLSGALSFDRIVPFVEGKVEQFQGVQANSLPELLDLISQVQA